MKVELCEPCVKGKIHRPPFPKSGPKRASAPLVLVHSEVCGKLDKSLGLAEYFLTFIDDHSRFVWTYTLKRKDEVFPKFLEWKSMIENSTDLKLKCLRTDNGGDYLSSKFTEYLKSDVRHELTVPNNPEQNGVAERQKRTLVG